MTSISLDSRVTIGPDVVFRELDGEAVILNLETGLYFGLNEMGTRIWQRLDAHGEVRASSTRCATSSMSRTIG